MIDIKPLPVDDVLPELVDGLRRHGSAVLRAPTGAGKTTRVPPALLRAGMAAEGTILVLQPRRIAARATAARMAAENGWPLGGEVGYRTRFDRQNGPQTRILAVTEGILLRMLGRDPFLQDVAVVVFDEFHERNLASDLALGMVRQIQQTVRPDLRILVMSATLDTGPIARYLDDCPSIVCQGRLFPVDVLYASPANRRSIAEVAADGVREVLDRTNGDVLVFLPGLREIHQTKRLLAEVARQANLSVLELYGDLPADRQDSVLQPCRQRKVILSTNVAETSLTIEGVTAVVDSGWARSLRFDSHVGLDRLQLTPISRASADQRAGRAGRTEPGVCLRLWDQRSHRSRLEHDVPEIRRADLSGAILQLLCWIEPDVNQFPWFEAPPCEAVENALHLLQRLGAADSHEGQRPLTATAESAAEKRRSSELVLQVTRLGRRIASLPTHPRLGRLLTEAQRLGCLDRAALASALLSERTPFVRSARGAGHRTAESMGAGKDTAGLVRDRSRTERRTADFHSQSDIIDQLTALEAFESHGTLQSPCGPINRSAAGYLFRVRDQLVRRVAGKSRSRLSPEDADQTLLRALLAAFPDRLARRRASDSTRGVMVGGRGVRLADESRVLGGEFFLCIDVDDAGSEALVRRASFVDRAWLSKKRLRDEVDVAFDSTNERVSARRRVFWEDLVIEETAASVPDGTATSEVLAHAARTNWDRVFPKEDSAVARFTARVRWLCAQIPELDLPSLDERMLRDLLPDLCAGRRSFDQLRKAPWMTAVKGLFRFDQLQTIDREAPERMSVPSGRSVPLRYEENKPPILAVRIQEMFGLAETPRVAGGRVRVLLHLLAPNMRVQQVTDDLQSFWKNVYPQVRKELRGRYPKHAWPEDPNVER